MTFVIFLSSMSSHMVDKYTLGCSSKCAHITFKWSVTYKYIIHVCCFSFTTQIRKRKVIIAICSAKALMSKPLNNNSISYKKTCKNTKATLGWKRNYILNTQINWNIWSPTKLSRLVIVIMYKCDVSLLGFLGNFCKDKESRLTSLRSKMQWFYPQAITCARFIWRCCVWMCLWFCTVTFFA